MINILIYNESLIHSHFNDAFFCLQEQELPKLSAPFKDVEGVVGDAARLVLAKYREYHASAGQNKTQATAQSNGNCSPQKKSPLITGKEMSQKAGESSLPTDGKQSSIPSDGNQSSLPADTSLSSTSSSDEELGSWQGLACPRCVLTELLGNLDPASLSQ